MYIKNVLIENKKIFLLFFLIILIASLLRLYNLDSIPPHPSLDEVSTGYNAYSILKTGGDEYGNKTPVLLRAYDDYRPAHYAYLVTPFVNIFGLNVFSVRFPSAILSLATIVFSYFLAVNIFEKSKNKYLFGLLVMFLLSISPWHIYISRLGHEVNLFYTTFIIGATLALSYLRNERFYILIAAAVMLGISFSSYQTGKIFIPLFITIFGALFIKEFFTKKIKTFIAVVLFLLVSLPILQASFSPQALVRFEATNIYTSIEEPLKISAQKVLEAKENNDLIGQIVNNRRFVYLFLPFNAYLSHFNPFWLASNGGDEPFKVPGSGLLYVMEIPLILMGAAFLFFSKKIDTRAKILLLGWLLISIIPGAITNGYPHAMRTMQILPLPQLLIALGVFSLLNSRKNRMVIASILAVFYLISISIFIQGYFYLFQRNIAWQFQYGIQDAFFYAKSVEDKYPKIFVENNKNLFQSYMFYLYFNQYDPEKYQEAGGTISGGYAQTHQIGKYLFGPVPDKSGSKSLFILNPDSRSSGNVMKWFYFPDGKPALKIIEE